MADAKNELRIRLLSGYEFTMDVRSSPHSRDIFDHVDEIVSKTGATETHADGSWTRYPPSQIESVTCQPMGTGVKKSRSPSVGLGRE
jgi:hypothetical protein